MVVLAHIGKMIADNTDSEIQGQISSDCLLTLTVNKYVLKNPIMAKLKNRLFICSVKKDTE